MTIDVMIAEHNETLRHLTNGLYELELKKYFLRAVTPDEKEKCSCGATGVAICDESYTVFCKGCFCPYEHIDNMEDEYGYSLAICNKCNTVQPCEIENRDFFKCAHC